MEIYFKNRKAGYNSHVSMNTLKNNGQVIALVFFKRFSTGRRCHQGRNSWTGFQLFFCTERILRATVVDDPVNHGIHLSRYYGEDTFLLIEERVAESFCQINGLYRPEVWQTLPVSCRPATTEEMVEFRGYYPRNWSFVGQPESICSIWADYDSLSQENEGESPRFGLLNKEFDSFQGYCTPEGKIKIKDLEIDPIAISFRNGCQRGRIPSLEQIRMAQRAYPKTPENRVIRELIATYIKVAIEFVE